jgi:hypothetical protein
MPIGHSAAAVTTGTSRLARSRIGASLRRLHDTLETTGRVETHVADQFALWQQKWSSRRDQIAQRLEVIDSQLEQLVQHHFRRPQLSVISNADESHLAEELVPLEAY